MQMQFEFEFQSTLQKLSSNAEPLPTSTFRVDLLERIRAERVVCMRFRNSKVCACTTPCANAKQKTCDEIVDGLLLGPVEVAFNVERCLELNVTHVLDLSGANFQAPECISLKRVALKDEVDADLLAVLDDCVGFIAAALAQPAIEEDSLDRLVARRRSVLVVCAMGISRSASVVAAFLIKHLNMTRDEALALVASKRPQVSPNEGFLRQLLEFESQTKTASQ
jgi:hypothetical protein